MFVNMKAMLKDKTDEKMDYRTGRQQSREKYRLCAEVLDEVENLEVHDLWIAAVLLNPGTKKLGFYTS